jgi:hypothetical protein
MTGRGGGAHTIYVRANARRAATLRRFGMALALVAVVTPVAAIVAVMALHH